MTVGAANAVLALLALVSDAVLLSAAAAGGLLVAGMATAGAGALVWRGSRPVALVALTILGLLLVVQLGDLALDGIDGVIPRLVVMTLLVGTLALAVLGTRPRPR